jgi:predicted RNA-binding protein with PUA-like domain
MTTFLLKTEPSVYSFEQLEREGSCTWDGVANAAALQAIRTMRPGDEVFIYHTADERAIVGLARVTSLPREDPANPGKTPSGEPKFAVIDLEPVKAVRTPVTLAQIKQNPAFAEFALLRQSRLSAMEVPAPLVKILRKSAGL